MERSIHDALCAVKRVLESKSVVAGGGCVEAALSIYLENFATSLVFHSFTMLYIDIFFMYYFSFKFYLLYRAHESNLQ